MFGKLSTTLAPALILCCLTAQAQVRERDVKITGPRGRTVERQLESVRGPGGVRRDTTIVRPGGTYQREVDVRRGPMPFGGRGGFGGFGGPFVRNNIFVERDVVVPPPRPFLPFGSSFNLSLGLPLFAPPAPVYVQPAPVVVAPPVTNVYAARPAVGVDPVADAIGRLSSFHANSRRDGAYTLGRFGDSRAVPPLIDRLKNDGSKDVRMAAATALGQIGEPSTAIILERAITYDKKQEVRDAAALALSKMPKEIIEDAPITSTAAAPPRSIVSRPATSAAPPRNDFAPIAEPAEEVPPPPVPDTPR